MSSPSWKRVIFSDEKRFCLDGSDGQACFWGDKRLPLDIFSKRARGGGGVMIWGAISWRGKTNLVRVKGTLDAGEYVQMLEEHLMPFIEEHHTGGCVFQQDGAPAHSAKHTREFLMMAGITDMVWPAKSPDLNCIENMWGEMARRVYHGGRQFESEEDLLEAIYYEWNNIGLDYVRDLIRSMPNRADECLKKRGRITNY